MNIVYLLYCSALFSRPCFFSYIIEKYCYQGFLDLGNCIKLNPSVCHMDGNNFRHNEGSNSSVVTFTQSSNIFFFTKYFFSGFLNFPDEKNSRPSRKINQDILHVKRLYYFSVLINRMAKKLIMTANLVLVLVFWLTYIIVFVIF